MDNFHLAQKFVCGETHFIAHKKSCMHFIAHKIEGANEQEYK